MVQRVGVPWHALHQPRLVPQVVSAFVRDEFQDADAGDSRSARLPAGCVRGISALHDPATAGRAVEDALLPRRRSLGAQAAEFPALVQDGGGWGSEASSRFLTAEQAAEKVTKACCTV